MAENKMDTKVDLSVVIVNYNVKYYTEACLLSVRKASQGLSAEIFVVDNHSSDGSVEYLSPLFPEVKWIVNDNNPGFSKANNQAIKESCGEFVLLLNPDTMVGEDCFLRLVDFMREHPSAGALGVKMIEGQGTFLPESKRGFPSPWVSFCKAFGLTSLFPKSPTFARYYLPYLHENEVNKIDVISGAFMMLSRLAIQKVGMLDESFFMYGEDIDLSYRVKQGGFDNYYVPERILHFKGESTQTLSMNYVRVFYQAMRIFYRKHYQKSGWLMSTFVNSGIWLRAVMAANYRAATSLFTPGSAVKPLTRMQRILIVSTQEMLPEIEQLFAQGIQATPVTYHVEASLLPDTSAIEDLIRKEKITDVVWTLEQVPFSYWLSSMDVFPFKQVVKYYFYNPHSQVLIASGYLQTAL